MSHVSDKSCKENQNKFYIKYLYFFENHAIHELMFKYIVEPGRPQMTVWLVGIACWIPTATDAHSHIV
jgi:hypothetical protein